MRLLNDNELGRVAVDGKPVEGAFAVDERAGVARCYVLDAEGRPVYEGSRRVVKDVKGKVEILPEKPMMAKKRENESMGEIIADSEEKEEKPSWVPKKGTNKPKPQTE